MAQTRMFRDRVVSMEQTLEGGEKHLALLKELCREALPGFEYQGHVLDHERDLFVMEVRSADGTAKRIAWTRMVLFDTERIPSLAGDPAAILRARIVDFVKSRAARSEIVVTFRHLEEGWIDTPEPRRESSRRRRRSRGRGGERGGGERRPAAASGAAPAGRKLPPSQPSPATAAVRAAEPKTQAAPGAPGGKRRRRFRRRRRGRGAAGGPAGSAPPSAGPRA